jgi:hypothetical protein
MTLAMTKGNEMIPQPPQVDYDSSVHITDYALVEKLGDAALVGKWFVFLKANWLARSGMDRVLASSGVQHREAQTAILFRGKDEIALPGAIIAASPLPRPELVALTSDKALYAANRDTVRLLITAPQHAKAGMKLALRLSGNSYATYPLALDEFGLCLWSMQGLPEGRYEAVLEGIDSDPCHFEVAEYRLAPLNAELAEQNLSGNTLRYVLKVTAFGQPYSGPVEVELQERGQRVGNREKLTCNREGLCRGVVKLTGPGPYTLNIFAGERTATAALKGSEQERRETLVISELGEIRTISLLPSAQSNACRGMYISRGGSNNEPFLVQRVVGSEVEITARVDAELLCVVVVDPTRGTSEEHVYRHVQAKKSLQLPIPMPYGVVLLGAFIDDTAWEGWCGILRPSTIHLHCEAPKEAKPGARIQITLKTGKTDSIIPVQLIVKDQRLIAPADPQVELAARIKQNFTQWRQQTRTGEVERQLSNVGPRRIMYRTANGGGVRPLMAAMPMVADQSAITRQFTAAARPIPPAAALLGQAQFTPPAGHGQAASNVAVASPVQTIQAMTQIRLQFPEIVYNNILKVRGETSIEVKLGDSMTRYSIEAFALAPDNLDWQRVETTLDTVQPVYGELTVSPFVRPGDPVLGRLDVGAASGGAIVEVRHDNEVVPLFFDNGEAVTPGLPIPSGSVVRFPLKPGAITASVRDARKGGIDVSERYVTEPGKLRHIVRHLRILTPGEEVTAREPRVLEIRPLPGLDSPFQVIVEGAAMYPFGCVEQTSTKLFAMFTGYIVNMEHAEAAREYEAAIPIWYKRLKSMYLPKHGFCFYPPEEGGSRKPDTHYAPLAVKNLLKLPTAERAGIKQQALCEMLDDIATMALDAAAYYKIENPPKKISDCQSAYQILTSSTSQKERDDAAAYVRSRLTEHNGQTYVEMQSERSMPQFFGMAVSTRAETAYAAAALLATQEASDLPKVIAATNYLTSQLNAEGRLYSTVDTAACLALMLGLRESGIVTTAGGGRVQLNGQEVSLAEALASRENVESLRCTQGVIAAEVISEFIEDWSAFKNTLPVKVRLERDGQAQERFKAGDALDLVISVPRYEPGLIAHVCLPDALARVAGGGQVKRFSLDFCEKNELRVPLAAISPTGLPQLKDAGGEQNLLRWFGLSDREQARKNGQHWAVIVRNMFKEEQVGNPGLMRVVVE